MRSSIILATVFALPIFGAVLPQDSAIGIPGYGIEDVSWDVTLPDGSNVTLAGTAEQVAEQLDTLSPEWRDSLNDVNARSLAKRTYFDPQDVRCGGFPQTSNQYRVINAISYLRGVGGRPANGPGPGNCGRVSCAYDLGVYWCNDSRDRKELESFGSIADGAQAILDKCMVQGVAVGIPPIPQIFLSGQAFHPTEWNVIVRADSC